MQLLKKVENGFQQLKIGQQHIKTALEHLAKWLSDDMFKDYRAQIEYLIASEKWSFLLDSFYQVMPFGTGGRRGLVGIGPNRINLWTIRASAQGHSQYLLQQYGQEAQKRGLVLAYDVREYSQKGVYDDSLANPVMDLNCKQLAEAAAQVYVANGIKVFMFNGVRSTPELSFAIRYLQAVAGDVFSASHNLPTDNGKKVYNESGGQLIPPYDQILVDQVTEKVTTIPTMSLEEAKTKGLLVEIGAEVDQAYWDAVISVSLAQERSLKILYSPLHGTGLTSVYPVLQQLGFDVALDPRTSNLSGAFENVTFHIPNPEVRASFDTSLPAAEKSKADIIINTDPDADRIGVMVKHKDEWVFLNGNEIGIILAQYGISKFKAKQILSDDCVIIKTGVTTSLIEKIAQENKIECFADLLVGFKYIGEAMEQLEKAGQMQKFILGTEESHGYIIGNYARDKDAACAAVWIAELAAELKKADQTLIDYLHAIYAQYGYCHNALSEIRLLGAQGMEQINLIMEDLRRNNIKALHGFDIKQKINLRDGKPFLSMTDQSARNVLIFKLSNKHDTQNIRMIVRPSGTEPKIKIYVEVFGKPCQLADLQIEINKISAYKDDLEKALLQYCYKVLHVDFPERGFLLFWQLPLESKLQYFKIEDEIVRLKRIPDPKIRLEKLNQVLEFLGADPITKVDPAFSSKYKMGIKKYLELI